MGDEGKGEKRIKQSKKEKKREKTNHVLKQRSGKQKKGKNGKETRFLMFVIEKKQTFVHCLYMKQMLQRYLKEKTSFKCYNQ